MFSSSSKRLFVAARNGNRKEVEKILQKKSRSMPRFRRQNGTDKTGDLVNTQDPDGNTVLHIATKLEHVAIVELLLNAGADCDLCNSEGKTPLHLASCRGSVEIVALLLSHRLFIAIESGNVQLVELMLSKIKSDTSKAQDVINAKNVAGKAPLHVASELGHLEIVKLLLDAGADCCAQDSYDWVPLHYAIDSGSDAMIQVLLDHDDSIINIRTKSGLTPFQIAMQKTAPKKFIIAANLVSHGAVVTVDDIQSKDEELHGWTALHSAARIGDAALVKHLIVECDADTSARQHSGIGWTPLHVGVLGENTDVVKVLLDCNEVDRNVTDRDGKTPLHLATSLGNVELCSLLLEKGAECQMKDNNQYTAKELAADRGHTAVVGVLSKQ